MTPMPTPTPTLEVKSDPYLSDLVVTGAKLKPAFVPDILNYEAVAEEDVRFVCIVAYARDDGAEITLNGVPVKSGSISHAVELKEGKNELIVKVVAEDGITSRTHRISVLLEALQLPTPTPDKSGNPFFSSLEDLLKENEVSPDGTKGGIFDDVPRGYWAEEYIQKLYEKGIISGIDEKTFMPGRPITRAEFTQIIVNSLKIPYREAGLHFNDVTEKDWYYKSVSSAAAFGIVVGRPDGSFAPNEFITRQDMAVVIAKFLEKKHDGNLEGMGKGLVFADSGNISEYARDSVAAVVSQGLMVGKPGNMFDPKGLTTRAEAVTVICKLMKY